MHETRGRPPKSKQTQEDRKKDYTFNLSNLDTVNNNVVIYMGRIFALQTPRNTISSKFRPPLTFN